MVKLQANYDKCYIILIISAFSTSTNMKIYFRTLMADFIWSGLLCLGERLLIILSNIYKSCISLLQYHTLGYGPVGGGQ